MKDFTICDWSVSSDEQKVKSTIAYITMMKQYRNITNKQICDATHIPESTFDKFMSGKTLRPDWINVIEIIRFLGGSVDALCGLSHESEIKRLRRKIAQLTNQLDVQLAHSELNALIVDDAPLNRDMLKWLLDERGITYAIATDGEEAFNLYMDSDEGAFDFILMDIAMPIMDGIEATKCIRESKRNDNDLPIIATTVRSKSFLPIFDDYLFKPIEVTKLDKIIEKVEAYVAKKAKEK